MYVSETQQKAQCHMFQGPWAMFNSTSLGDPIVDPCPSDVINIRSIVV